ncbi:MAG TPA: SpoIIE family protein phosphatase [Candidatus Dormibacteraeota bacterium]|nr:SpoIIE family protein phosphatase [Candidatus Dormibacteraeota bacterium]
MAEYGVAKFVLPGERESGDHYLVCCDSNGILIAAADGIGHGEEAANAAKAAINILRNCIGTPIIPLVTACHEKLRSTRGVVLSVASVDVKHGLMTWLGVGNVHGVLVRPEKKGGPQETLMLRGGVVGDQLPQLQAAVLPVGQGDMLVFATDGIRTDFTATLSALENPQRAADRILKGYSNGSDDALVLALRITGIRP